MKNNNFRAVFALAVAVLVVAGCQTTRDVWMRADGVPIGNDPRMSQQFELDRTMCNGQVAQVQMGSNNFCYGAGNCLGTAIARGIQSDQVRQGCMASKGYVLRTITEDTSQPQVAQTQ